MKLTRYITPAVALMALCGCSSEPEAVNVDNTADEGISVSAAYPDLAMSSRASVNDKYRPVIPGTCAADRIRLYFYDGANPNNLTVSTEADPLTDLSVRRNKYNGIDRYTNHKHNFGALSGDSYHYVTALAYTNADADRFTIFPGSKPAEYVVSIPDGKLTPELYFGNLKMKEESGLNVNFDGVRNYVTGASYSGDVPLSGELFRVVSQFNVVIKDINESSNIDHVDLVLSDYPVKVKMSGTHGIWYPVCALPADNADATMLRTRDIDTKGDALPDGVVVATDASFTDGKANFSFYMLPSELGTEMTARVVFSSTIDDDDDRSGCELQGDGLWHHVAYIPLRPSNDYYLSSTASEVYTVTNTDMRPDANSPIKVYNEQRGRYYSLSNVRLNITGSLKDVAEINVEIHVESGYEKEHTIPVN